MTPDVNVLVAAARAGHPHNQISVTDAWIAAAVLHLGEHLVTLDRGFRKLLPPDQLTVLDPAAS